jgi:hypothetical protein
MRFIDSLVTVAIGEVALTWGCWSTHSIWWFYQYCLFLTPFQLNGVIQIIWSSLWRVLMAIWFGWFFLCRGLNLLCWILIKFFLLVLLMLDLELLVRLGRDLDFIPNAIVNLRFILDCTSHDIICKESFVHNSIKRSRCTEILVINVTIFCWINSDEISSLLIFYTRFSH